MKFAPTAKTRPFTLVGINGGGYDPSNPGVEATLNLQFAADLAHAASAPSSRPVAGASDCLAQGSSGDVGVRFLPQFRGRRETIRRRLLLLKLFPHPSYQANAVLPYSIPDFKMHTYNTLECLQFPGASAGQES
jgi:hypothetical protein